MMQRVVTVCLCLLLFALKAQASEPENELTLYGVVIEATPLNQDSRGDILEDPKRIKILNLGKVVNHGGLDYGPTVSADGKTLFFVSNRQGSRITRDGDFSHDFWLTRKAHNLDTIFSIPVNIDTVDAGVNTVTNEGVASIAADKQTLYFTGCNRADGLGDCDIYIAEVEGDRFGKPRNLGRAVNSEYWDSQPTISPDKQRLYFTSNRPSPTNPDGDGQKDTDIWYSDWDDDLGEWKPAKNLGPDVNTAKAEVSPFIAADGNTLFFASNGHLPNMGGLDFYRTVKTGERDREGRDRWSKSSQLPAPINTAEDEQFISLPASGDVLYFSSRRTDLPGYQGDLDIFMALIPTYFRAVNLIVNVVDECTQQSIPATLTFSNPKTGRNVRDSVSTSRTEANVVIGDAEYGGPDNRDRVVQWTVGASSPVYGETSITVDVADPGQTTAKDSANVATEIRRTITLGRRPTLTWDAAYSDWEKKKNGNFKGLVIEERATIIIYPLLPYIFFDLSGATIPSRYVLFNNPTPTANFNDERIPGGTLDKYYQVLNIFGYRLKKHPTVSVEITGTVDEKFEDKNSPLPKERAQIVYNYLRDVWGIEESRMSMKSRGYPEEKSNPKDSLGMTENRRAEIRFKGDAEEVWQVARPILDNDPTDFPSPKDLTFQMANGIDNEIVASRRIEIKRAGAEWNTLTNVGMTEPSNVWNFENPAGEIPKGRVEKGQSELALPPYEAQLVVVSKNGTECRSDVTKIPVKRVSSRGRTIEKDEIAGKTLEKYNLILFDFDKFTAGPMNERILREYVFGRVKPSSDIKVDGHTDVVGEYGHNKKLSENRSRTVENAIKSSTGGKYQSLISRGTGEDEPLYNNILPEERFFNRTVQVIIETPLQDAGLDD
ncbi:MAG: OmpA family protein [bacterium]|nr:OmpA family protein [bacterium]